MSIDVPDETLIGEDFQFQVKFKNAVATGYGPYIELYLPARGADGNSLGLQCDGISFVSAEASFANPPTVALPPKYDSLLSNSSGNMRCPIPYSLPFAGMTSVGGTAPSGDYQLVVIELPFGSFDPSQPEVLVNVKANLSDHADVNTPLTIYARGGFRYGSDALDNHPADLLLESALTFDQTTPTVFKLKKAYLGPEDEAVSGPNFIGYYPLKYQLTADIADQQTINKLVITDNLPGNLQFAGNVQVKIKGNNANPVAGCATNPGLNDVEISAPAPFTPPPGGTLTVKLCSPIVGSTAPNDVAVTFDFFIPDKDANNKDILDSDCKNSPVFVKNDIAATGDWDPIDPRDPNPGDPAGTTIPVPSNLTNVDHVLQAKCVAIQKKVAQRLPDTGGPGLTPGDTLRYELNFQISDYRSMGKITITDLLSDGQLLTGAPTMTVLGDQFGSYTNMTFNASTFSAAADLNLSCPNPGGIKGGIRVTFRVSAALAAAATASGGHARHQSGILTGGHATVPTSSTPARGQIVFYAKIQNKFTYQYPNTAKEFVDKDDPLNNCVTIEAQVFQNEANPATVPSIALGPTSDGSSTQVRIAKAIPKKSVYAVKRGNSINSPIICGPAPNTACLNLPGTPQDVHPGDAVTFRIEYPIPSGDAEALSIEDWLPLPVFDVGDPDATPPSSAPLWPTAVAPCLAPAPYIPLPGMACRLTSSQATPGHTLAPPLSLAQGTANNLVFSYGTVENPLNTSKKIDLLFTVTA
ncbi:MAG TPA: isopeptide-forming domain-containing fimbrial protein, partial [Pyrinomonadaceae bacterium]|nr:isopeptide-forming domain-containing fimbrial protein [Pyrinomonadaceae bacterium]